MKGKSHLYTDANEDNSSFWDGWDIYQTQENTRKIDKNRGTKQIQSKGMNEKDNQNDEPSEDEIGNIKEGIIREAKLAINNYLLRVSLPENKLSANSDIVWVLTYCSRTVLELWSSDNDFTIDLPDDDSYLLNRYSTH